MCAVEGSPVVLKRQPIVHNNMSVQGYSTLSVHGWGCPGACLVRPALMASMRSFAIGLWKAQLHSNSKHSTAQTSHAI
jgi:hypothetical protein